MAYDAFYGAYDLGSDALADALACGLVGDAPPAYDPLAAHAAFGCPSSAVPGAPSLDGSVASSGGAFFLDDPGLLGAGDAQLAGCGLHGGPMSGAQLHADGGTLGITSPRPPPAMWPGTAALPGNLLLPPPARVATSFGSPPGQSAALPTYGTCTSTQVAPAPLPGLCAPLVPAPLGAPLAAPLAALLPAVAHTTGASGPAVLHAGQAAKLDPQPAPHERAALHEHAAPHKHAAPHERRMYRLMLVDEASGQPLRAASAGDAADAARLLGAGCGGAAIDGGCGAEIAECLIPPCGLWLLEDPAPGEAAVPPPVSGAAGALSALGAGAAVVTPACSVGGAPLSGSPGPSWGRAGRGDGAPPVPKRRRAAAGSSLTGSPSPGVEGPASGAGAAPTRKGAVGKGGTTAGVGAPPRSGPCMHCGVAESPQWRRGPPGRSVLCNACGTRWRRTNSLTRAAPAAGRGRELGAGMPHASEDSRGAEP